MYNDPVLTGRVRGILESVLAAKNVKPAKPVMGGEDFSEFGRTADRIPICMFWLGAIEPGQVEASARTGQPLTLGLLE